MEEGIYGAVPAKASEAELRSAVRFPLRIPVRIFAGAEQGDDPLYGSLEAMTENISATGVLFSVRRPLPLQMQVRFTIKMPAKAVGTASDVVVHCIGRVVRCTSSEDCTWAAAVIDEYYFSQ